jgi:hypothetical protein
MKNYNIMAYLNGQLVPLDVEAESMQDAINLLGDQYGESLGPIVQARQSGFYMDNNGRISGVPEEI